MFLGPVMKSSAVVPLGYTAVGSGAVVQSHTSSSLSPAQTTLEPPGIVIAGDILVVMAVWGDTLQLSGPLVARTPLNANWSSAGGALHFGSISSSFNLAILPRIATATTEDNCYVWSRSATPVVMQMFHLYGNPYPGPLTSITAAAQDNEVASDALFSRDSAFTGGFENTVRFFASIKATTPSENGQVVGGTDSGIIQTAAINTGTNLSNIGMVAAFGYVITLSNASIFDGNWSLTPSVAARTEEISCTFKSGDS